MEIKKVLVKMNLLTQLKTKCEALNTIVRRFHSKFNMLHKKGLLEIVSSNDQLVKFEDYCERLYIIAANNNQFAGIKRQITSEEFLEALTSPSNMKLDTFCSLNPILRDIPNLMRYLEGR